MKKIFNVFALCLMVNASIAQDSVSVLFIGNSYTGVNNLPLMVHDLTVSLGDILMYDSHNPGGQTLANHAASATVYNKIDDHPWDFVVLQAQSQEPSFADAQVNTQTLPYAIQLSDSIYANNFCSETLFYMTWGRENGDPQWQPISTFDGMNARLRSAYMRFADSVQGSVSPVGSAWKYIRDNHPTINLYAGDGSHPSYEGSYLAACTFYASLFRKSPIGAPFIGSLDPTVAELLQTAASMTVLDSLEQWNLRPISEHTQAEFTSVVAASGTTIDFTNHSTKATNYVWDFGDGNSSTDEHPSHTYSSFGNFSVSLVAGSPCDSDTMTVNFSVVAVDELEQSFKIATLGNGIFQITSGVKISQVKVMDSRGVEVDNAQLDSSSEAKIDLSSYAAGTYFVHLKTEKGASVLTLMR